MERQVAPFRRVVSVFICVYLWFPLWSAVSRGQGICCRRVWGRDARPDVGFRGHLSGADEQATVEAGWTTRSAVTLDRPQGVPDPPRNITRWGAPSLYGTLLAHVHLSRGHREIKSYGKPALWRAEYERLLHERYKVECNTVAGCMVPFWLEDYFGSSESSVI